MNDRHSAIRNNLPPSLDELLRTEPSCAVEKVEALVLFPNGGYFLSCSNGKWGTLTGPVSLPLAYLT